MNGRASSNYRHDTKARQSEPWRRKASRPKRASSIAGSNEPMPLSEICEKVWRRCWSLSKKSRQSWTSRNPIPSSFRCKDILICATPRLIPDSQGEQSERTEPDGKLSQSPRDLHHRGFESRVSDLKNTVDELKITMDKEFARMKEIRKVPEYLSTPKRALKPIVDRLQKIKFDKAKAKYKAEHEKELKQYYAVRRKLGKVCPDGKYDGKLLTRSMQRLKRLMQKPMPSTKLSVRNIGVFGRFTPAKKGCHAEQTHQKKRSSKARGTLDSFLSLRFHSKTRKDD